MVNRGVKEAAAINKIVTIAKVIPLLVFLALVIFAFKPGVFAANLWGGGDKSFGNLFFQAKETMLVTVFVFLGIEGASNYSRYAEKREDVGWATVVGFLSVLALFASVSILAYGVLPRGEIAELRQPSVAGVLEAVVGAVGRGVPQRRTDHLRARRVPGLDADGRGGALDRRQEAGHAGLPGAREQERGALERAAG